MRLRYIIEVAFTTDSPIGSGESERLVMMVKEVLVNKVLTPKEYVNSVTITEAK